MVRKKIHIRIFDNFERKIFFIYTTISVVKRLYMIKKNKKDFEHIIMDITKIEDVETFIFVITHNAPLVFSLTKLLSTAHEKDFLKIDEVFLLQDALIHLNDAWKILMNMCEVLSTRSVISKEEVYQCLKDNMRGELDKIYKKVCNKK